MWDGPPQNLTPLQQSTGEHLLNAYELSGICAPTLLPRIGITEGNREVFSLGMTMPQLIDAKRYNPAETLWTGDAPDGERLDEYVATEIAGKKHHGQTPVAIAQMVADASPESRSRSRSRRPRHHPPSPPRVRPHRQRHARHRRRNGLLQPQNPGRSPRHEVRLHSRPQRPSRGPTPPRRQRRRLRPPHRPHRQDLSQRRRHADLPAPDPRPRRPRHQPLARPPPRLPGRANHLQLPPQIPHL